MQKSDSFVPVAVFRLGHIVATPNALQSIPNKDILKAIQRHQAGDWGNLDSEDRNSNDQALMRGGRLFSVYNAGDRSFGSSQKQTAP